MVGSQGIPDDPFQVDDILNGVHLDENDFPLVNDLYAGFDFNEQDFTLENGSNIASRSSDDTMLPVNQNGKRPRNLESRLQELVEKKGIAPFTNRQSFTTEFGSPFGGIRGEAQESSDLLISNKKLYADSLNSNLQLTTLESTSNSDESRRYQTTHTVNGISNYPTWESISGFQSIFMDRTLFGPPDSILRQRLFSLAEAIVTHDEPTVLRMRDAIEKEASLTGTPIQRLSHYCLTGLDMKVGHKRVATSSTPLLEMPKETQMLFSKFSRNLPYVPIALEATLRTILEAVDGKSRIHIIDFGSWPHQWCILLRQLARRPGGMPRVRMTAVVTRGDKSLLRVNYSEMSKELEGLAFELGLPFQLSAVHLRIENLQSSGFFCNEGEAVVVNSVLHFQNLPDASVLRFNPRDKLLQVIRELEPLVVLMTEVDADLNTNFFLPRFKRVVEDFESFTSSLEQGFSSNFKELVCIEGAIVGSEVINNIACEGLDRWCRPERFDKWTARFRRAGFAVRPLSDDTRRKLVAIVDGFPRFTLNLDRGAAELVFNGSPSITTIAWRVME